MKENVAKNRAILVHKEDYRETELMLWLYDLRVIETVPSKEHSECAWIMFRCSDTRYQKIYEKMDALGSWRGDLTNPKLSGCLPIECDTENISDVNYSKNCYLVIGV